MKKSILALSAIALLATGCSSMSKSDLMGLRADINAAKNASNQAYQVAKQANMNAQDAKAMSLKTNEKLNRMFKKAQMK
ncbi:MAG: alanine-zipper protein [Ostreibacterium sp.]